MVDNSRRRNINTNFYLELARGRIEGASDVHKFGAATNVDTADGIVNLWDGMANNITTKIPVYTYSTTADITHLACTDNTYTGHPVTLEGLDANWDYTIQTINVTGNTPAELLVPLVRVFRGYISNAVELGDTDHIYVGVGDSFTSGIPDDLSDTRCVIHGNRGQTQMSMYSVPRGYKLYITRGWSTLAGKLNVNIIMYIRVRDFGGVWRRLHITSHRGAGSSSNERAYEIPLVLDSQMDIEYLCETDANDGALSAGFHAMLIREDYANSSPKIIVP